MKDKFSRQSELYAKYRPGYPPELFDFVLSHLKERDCAWDCATGNGQTAKELASYFLKVCATDISEQQLNNACKTENIFYSLQPAEQTDFANDSFDLVTVSQALHWLQFDAFYTEVKRVCKPGAWIAVWMYGLLSVSPEIDERIRDHHDTTLEHYWEYERKYVTERYATIPFPFEEIECPLFQIDYEWTSGELEGYLNTWSGLQSFIHAKGYNPVDELMKEIRALWIGEKMKVCFPLYVRMGKVEK